MRLVWSERSWAEYLEWQNEDRETLGRVNRLVGECLRHPFFGTGKPEPLKNEFRGFWSRRITDEHRLVYRVSGKDDAQELEIAQCRWHY